MNRNEVIERYKALVNYRYSHGMEYDMSPGGITKDTTTDLMESVLRELTKANPDPITGLVPCGCGNQAEIHYGVYEKNDYYVECGACGIGTRVITGENDAKRVWNTAMGYKGGE